jgi:hypothetical protein
LKLSSSELEKLHFNIFSIFSANFSSDQILKSSKFFPELPSSLFSSSSLSSVISSPDFGSFSEDIKGGGSKGLSSFKLNDHYTLNLRNSLFSMFDISISFDKHQVTYGDKLTISLTIMSFFLDALIPDQMILYFIDNSLTYSFFHENGVDSDHSNSKTKHLESRKENLCFYPSLPKTFTIHVDVNEERFAKFLSYDNLFCIERIELIWKSSSSSSTSVEEPVLATSSRSEKSLTFNLSALPKDILTILTVPKSVATSASSSSQLSHLTSSSSLPPSLPQINPFTIKDVYSFSLADSLYSSYSVIVKPKGLIKLISPSLDSGPVLLLQDLIQRVDLYFSSPLSFLDNVNIFLSSDRTISNNDNNNNGDDYLFWIPNLRKISEWERNSLQENHEKKNEFLSEVDFFPLALNSSMQPSYPYKLRNSVGINSVFCIPIFVRCKEVTSIKVKLSFEFIAKSIMKSSLNEDFSIDIKVKAPFSIQYCLSNDEIFYRDVDDNRKEAEEEKAHQLINSDIYRVNEADEISASSVNSLLFKLKCSNDLSDSIVVDSLQSSSLNQLNEELGFKVDSESVTGALYRSTLRLDEELLLSRYLSSHGNQKASLQKLGSWNIQWNLSSVHPLKFTCPTSSVSSFDKFSLFSSESFNWLITPFLSISDVYKQFENYVKVPQNGRSLARTAFPLPELKVSTIFMITNRHDSFFIRFLFAFR